MGLLRSHTKNFTPYPFVECVGNLGMSEAQHAFASFWLVSWLVLILNLMQLRIIWKRVFNVNFFDLFCVYECFTCVYVCVPHVCLLPEEVVSLHVGAGN